MVSGWQDEWLRCVGSEQGLGDIYERLKDLTTNESQRMANERVMNY